MPIFGMGRLPGSSNGIGMNGSFSRNPNAELPNTTMPYEEIMAQQKALTVLQTAPDVPGVGGIIATDKIINGTRWLTFKNPHGEWNNSEIHSPPDEILAKKDIERQKAIEKKMIDNLSDEQKEMLRQLETGELVPKSKLIEESKKIQRVQSLHGNSKEIQEHSIV